MLLCFSSMSALEPRCLKAEALNAAAQSLDSASWSARSPAEVSWLAARSPLGKDRVLAASSGAVWRASE